MNTLITFPDGRTVERKAPENDAEFWAMSEAWLRMYPSDKPADPAADKRLRVCGRGSLGSRLRKVSDEILRRLRALQGFSDVYAR